MPRPTVRQSRKTSSSSTTEPPVRLDETGVALQWCGVGFAYRPHEWQCGAVGPECASSGATSRATGSAVRDGAGREGFVTVASSLTFLICSVAATSIPAAQMTQMLMTALWGSDCIGIARSWWGGREAPARLRRWIASALYVPRPRRSLAPTPPTPSLTTIYRTHWMHQGS